MLYGKESARIPSFFHARAGERPPRLQEGGAGLAPGPGKINIVMAFFLLKLCYNNMHSLLAAFCRKEISVL